MSIIISQDGKNAQKIDKSDFEKEGYLQNYIHENPESIPVYEIDEDKKLFVVAREFLTESGTIDALAIDKDGDIYVVETKLYKNPDKRTVVAQALDYGASLWRHSDYGEFINTINSEINKKFQISFEEKVKDFFNIDEEQIEVILEATKRNLQQGNIKFVILMDAIDDRLKDLIVYINQNSQFDIYAVQMEYYKFENYEIMIPKLFGAEVKKSISSTTSSLRKKWDEPSFLQDAKYKLSEKGSVAIEKLYRFSKEFANNVDWGTGNTRGSFSAQFTFFSQKALYILRSNGRLSIAIGYTRRGSDQNQNQQIDLLVKELKRIGIQVPNDESWIALEEDELINKVDSFIDVLKNQLK